MKSIKHLFTTLLLLCATMATAHDFKVGGIYYNILSETDKTVAVTYQGDWYKAYTNEYTGSVVIPESVIYNGSTYSVTSIGREAFEDCTGITSIEIPNSVTSIGYRAFRACTGLTSITIPNSVTSIGWNAFSDCYNLKSITIPNSITSIESSAFEGTAWYNNQPNGVVYAGKVLYGYKGTMPENTSITIKDGTSKIADGAFSGCTGLTSITIPNSVTSIGDYAFRGCSGLTSITIPNSVTSIGDWAFWGCSKLDEALVRKAVNKDVSGAFGKGNKMKNQKDGNNSGRTKGKTGGKAIDSGKGISVKVGNRKLGAGGLVTPVYNKQAEGKVVVDVTVDPSGKVVSASINAKLSNTTNQGLRNAALSAARQTKFNEIEGVDNESGTITYIFRLK